MFKVSCFYQKVHICFAMLPHYSSVVSSSSFIRSIVFALQVLYHPPSSLVVLCYPPVSYRVLCCHPSVVSSVV